MSAAKTDDEATFDTAPAKGGSSGRGYIGLATVLLAFSVFYSFPTLELRSYVALASSLATTVIIQFTKLSLKPLSTYVLALESILLNTIGFGTMFPFSTFVAVSSVVTGLQAFMSLPMRKSKKH